MSDSPLIPDSLSLPAIPTQPPLVLNDSPSFTDVDPQILEALRSKDRLYVLKLAEFMERLINDRRPRIDLPNPATSYQRLLVHRCSAYYKLAPETDPATKGIAALVTQDSRIPARRICDLVPPEANTAPAFKIMRRSPPDRRPNRTFSSHSGSVAADEQDLSDPEPSESGSQGSRSNPAARSNNSTNKSRMTIEEREAAYNEARSRIFMGFDEKEKEKDPSASSSSLSLVSGSVSSTSANGGSSVSGDPDDSVSSPATESEFSSGREKKDPQPRYPGKNVSASSSSRSLRSYGTGSSRNSRASSPSSFTYPNIYDPNPATYYDHSQSPPGYVSQYMIPYPPPGPYYPPGYPYYHHPHHQPYPYPSHSASDPTTPSTGDPYNLSSPPPNSAQGGPAAPTPAPAAVYPPYAWQPPQIPMQSPPHLQQQPPPPPPPAHQYPYMHPPPHAYTYPMPAGGYYPTPPPPPPPPQMEPQQSPPAHPHAYDVSRSLNGSAMGHQGHGRNGSPAGNGHGQHQGGRSNRHNSMNAVGNGVKGRGPPPMNQGRAAWSYGPGVGQGGHVSSQTETIGPRLNNARRTSNNSIASSATSRSSNCDEVSSTASSSTTSSSSRRTYTSTASSQHPLPARPDWAVGLKPQPTLHATQPRHHDHSHNNSRTMSPISAPRNLNGHHQHNHHNNTHGNNNNSGTQQQPVPLQSPTEFPPLSSTPEKRVPVVSGAWGNTSSTRNIRVLSPGQNAPSVVHHGSNGASPSASASSSAAALVDNAMEESDRAFERPPPKSSAELFNPKVLKRPQAAVGQGKAAASPPPPQEKESPVPNGPSRADAASTANNLADQVEGLSLDGSSGVTADAAQ